MSEDNFTLITFVLGDDSRLGKQNENTRHKLLGFGHLVAGQLKVVAFGSSDDRAGVFGAS